MSSSDGINAELLIDNATLRTANERLTRELEKAKEATTEMYTRVLLAENLHYIEGQRLAAVEAAFLHTHQAKYVDGELGDECRWCGLDIRNAVHRRMNDGSRTSWIELALIYADVGYAALDAAKVSE